MRKCIVVFFLLLCVMLTGCGKKSTTEVHEFYDNGKYISVDVQADVISFNLALLTKDKVKEVNYLSLGGEDVSPTDFSGEIDANMVEQIENYHYRDLYFSYWLVTVTPNEEVTTAEINNMNISVDGEKRKIEFSTPIKFSSGSGTKFSGALEASVVPNEFSSSFIDNTQTCIYTWNATEKLKITDIKANAFIEPHIKFINEEKIESDKTSEKELSGSVTAEIVFKPLVECKFQSICTTMTVKYETEKGEDEFRTPLVFDPVYPINEEKSDNIKLLMDEIIDHTYQKE
ncbi:MAG: hypothetical protein HFJ09_08450 [Lachnospiraceae bacterium]|nr:hypothetical protein [Lachnospiraceae bacterium]